MITALVSIHDVMPESRSAVMHLLNELQNRVPTLKPAQVTLLVVPGKNWNDGDLLWLEHLQSEGYPFAGHGWTHTALKQKTPYHRVHSLVLSRNAAEHLSQPAENLQELVKRCYEWFSNHAFSSPVLYVPPAWATGCLTLGNWQGLPFKYLETLGGVMNIENGAYYALPLCGYEADTAIRSLFLRGFNGCNKFRAKLGGKPLRIGLHPCDHQCRLSKTIFQDLCHVDRFIDYSALPLLMDL